MCLLLFLSYHCFVVVTEKSTQKIFAAIIALNSFTTVQMYATT